MKIVYLLLIIILFNKTIHAKNDITQIPHSWLLNETKANQTLLPYRLKVQHITPQLLIQNLKILFPETLFSVLESQDMLLMKSSPQHFAQIQKIVRELDIPQPKIELSFQFIEISIENFQDYQNILAKISQNIPLSLSLESMPLFQSIQLKNTINFLHKKGIAHIKAEPKFITLNKQPATIEIGDKVPFTNTVINENSTSIQVNYIDTGLKIKAKPSLIKNPKTQLDEIKIEVEATLSTIKIWRELQNQKFPVISNRKSQTHIRLKNGESIILSGLLDEQNKSTLHGVPLLMDIPILGELFKQRKIEKTQTDMIIIVSAKVLN